MKWKVFDFETSNSKTNITKQYTRVWLWDIYDIETNTHETGDDIETFFNYLFKQPSQILYAHNLKFDGSFVVNYLLKHGFIISDDKSDYTISTLITDRLVWYTFTVHFNGNQYKFRDSSKKIIGALRDAAKSFKLDVSKGEIDYKLHRDKGYKATEKEIEYVKTDTEILAKIMLNYYEFGMTGITNAGDAMKMYKKMVSNTGYSRYFPILPKEIDDFIRKSYKGGYCYLNEKYYDKEINGIYVYDVNSMYPYVMAELDLPYGIPFHYIGIYEYDKYMPLFIQEVTVNCKLKKGCIPSIQTKSFMSLKLKYLRDTEGELIRLHLTNIDLDHLMDDYDIYEINFIQGYKFKSSNTLFKEYVTHFYHLKNTSEGALKQLYKIFLNSLYGKFAMMTERAQAYPIIERGSNKFNRTEKEIVEPVYTAVASFITAHARNIILQSAYTNIDSYIYSDTDSLHLARPAKGIEIDDKKLGAWAQEHCTKNGDTLIEKGKYLGQKCYILATNNGEIKKIAGAPNTVKEQINMKNFKVNFTSDPEYFPKYRMKNVDGGVLLLPIAFTINQKTV